MLIVDEAHRFKNTKSSRTRALRALAPPIPGVHLLMSGTPTPNGRHSELGAQVDILGRQAWREIDRSTRGAPGRRAAAYR